MDLLETETIGFFLVPDFSLIAFASAIEPLRLANRVSGKPLYSWCLISRDGTSVRASSGLDVGVQCGMTEAGRLATLVVCSGVDGHWYEDRRVFAWLRRLANGGAKLGSVCTASHILARAGLLNGYRCTIHWENLASFAESFPQVKATGELFTIDRDRFTCAGGTAAADMVLHMIAKRHGAKLAREVAEQLLHERIRPGTAAQPSASDTETVAEPVLLRHAMALMRENIEEPLDAAEIALRLGQSRRSLERLFRRYAGTSPTRYYLDLRLRRARQLLQQTLMPVLEVALACGFVSAAHFSKSFRAAYGVAPKSEQKRPPNNASRQRRRAESEASDRVVDPVGYEDEESRSDKAA